MSRAAVLDSVDEAIAIAEICGIPVEIVHLKCSGTDYWGKAPTILARLEAARCARARRQLRCLSLQAAATR